MGWGIDLSTKYSALNYITKVFHHALQDLLENKYIWDQMYILCIYMELFKTNQHKQNHLPHSFLWYQTSLLNNYYNPVTTVLQLVSCAGVTCS